MRVLGVDGGQAGIRLGDSDGSKVVEVEGVSRLEGDTVAQVAEAVARGWAEGAFAPVDRVVLGLTTCPADDAEAERLCRLVAAATGAPEILLCDDAVTAHAGALSGGWGVSVAAGTGVACLSRAESGAARIIGGHGYLLGDEGGAFWLGRQALAAVLRAAEDRGPATALTAAAKREFGNLDDLHIRVHESPRPVHMLASFAPSVLATAEAGDAVADAIIREGAMELMMVVTAASAWAARDGESSGPVPVALGGRLLAGGHLRRRLDDLLAPYTARIAPRSADGSPLDGALALGALASIPYGGLVRTWRSPASGGTR